MEIMSIDNLNYLDINNLSLNFNNEITFIVGDNTSCKLLLFKILSGDIYFNNIISINGTFFNNKNDYIKNIGVIKRLNENSFCYKSVWSELLYPLLKMGYNKDLAKKVIKDNLDEFDLLYIIDKNIVDLDIYEKQKLLIVMGIIHNPKVLLMDNPLDILKLDDAIRILCILKKRCNDGLSIIYFTCNLNYGNYIDRILLFSKNCFVGEYHYQDLYSNDKIFYDSNIEIPFLVDLNIKLKMYEIIHNNYGDIKALVDEIWD